MKGIKRKEASKILKECRDKKFKYTFYTLAEYQTAIDMAIEALEQEPKQVELEGDGYADGELVYDFGKCPNCGWEFEEGDKDWEEPYCCHCGQKLEWFDNEAEEQEPISPCDLCRYNPPSSCDGKPCTMCPAEGDRYE